MSLDPLIAQYEAWIYPKPIQDLGAYASAGGSDLSDPSRIGRKLWPRDVEPASLDILVAGCGANQAAIIAHANPQHCVIGIDLSVQAIAHHEYLKDKHQLSNLKLRLLAVEEVSALGQTFDYIVSTGVLHHLATPAAGLVALRRVLAPKGVISVMLYGQHRRYGIHMIQEAMRALDVGQDSTGLSFARDTVGNLPSWHHAHSYLGHAPDLGYDAGFVDTILNARECAYSVPEIMDLVSNAGLCFQSWLDGLYYSPAAAFPAHAHVHDRIYQLPREQQWHVVDLLTQAVGAHRFLVRHPRSMGEDIDIDFSDDSLDAAWLDCVPILHPDLRVIHGPNGSGRLEREWHSLDLAGKTFAAVQQVNHQLSFGELLSTVGSEYEYARALFAQLIEWDHLFYELRS